MIYNISTAIMTISNTTSNDLYPHISNSDINNTMANISSMDEALDGVGGEEQHSVTAAIYRIILPIICTFGITGILLTVIVLSRKNMKTSTNCYLMALAVADLLFLMLLATILPSFSPSPSPQGSDYGFHIYNIYAAIFMNICLIASSWLTVMLAIERYIAICRPFVAARFCSVNKARVFIIVIFVFAFTCRAANFWEYSINSATDPETNKTIIYPENTDLSFNEMYMTVYPWIIDGVLSSVIPFVLLVTLNVRLIWEVRKSTKYIKRNLTPVGSAANTVQKEELQITIMLISVIIVFFICQAPYVIYTAIISINKYGGMGPGFRIFRAVTMFLLVLKSALNFILYCWFSEKFLGTLKKIFCLDRCFLTRKTENGGGNYLHLRRFSTCATKESTF